MYVLYHVCVYGLVIFIDIAAFGANYEKRFDKALL